MEEEKDRQIQEHVRTINTKLKKYKQYIWTKSSRKSLEITYFLDGTRIHRSICNHYSTVKATNNYGLPQINTCPLMNMVQDLPHKRLHINIAILADSTSHRRVRSIDSCSNFIRYCTNVVCPPTNFLFGSLCTVLYLYTLIYYEQYLT